MLNEASGRPWTRKHDQPGVPLLLSTSRIVYPTSLAQLIELCASSSGRAEPKKAAGSHWALSRAAISDSTFVETHDPNNIEPAMGRTLREVLPGCISSDYLEALANLHPLPYGSQVSENEGVYPVHVESGKRVYQLCAELDWGDDDSADSLAVLLRDRFGNGDYLGPWAMPTLGGAGGQTVFGALTTGTHGGDFRMPPIADAVLAMHLVADGGHHYWVEPESLGKVQAPLTDRGALIELYSREEFKGNAPSGRDNFTFIRDDNLFNCVLVGAGRFGIVYSFVVGAVRQYSLHAERRLSTWQSIRSQIADRKSQLWTSTAAPEPGNRFLQVSVCLTPHRNSTRNLVGITKRWNVPMSVDARTGEPSGRLERRGQPVGFDAILGAVRFSAAGVNSAYSPDPTRPGAAAPISILSRACANADFLVGLLQAVADELERFIASKGAEIGATIAAVVLLGGGATLLTLLSALAVILPIILAVIASLAATTGPRLGQAMEQVKNALLTRNDPAEKAAGLFAWQMIAYQLFVSQQGDQDYEAISYAVMDQHDYPDVSCNVHAESVEVFFDASDPMLLAYVDALIAFEKFLEGKGLATVGYASLRFMGKSRATIAPAQHEVTCAVEVSTLTDVSGSREMAAFATTLALNPNFRATLHWGQNNPASKLQTERRFGDLLATQTGPLRTWRKALAHFTRNGALSGFSSEFTRQVGLEIVLPARGVLSTPERAAVGSDIEFSWDAKDNPESTSVSLQVRKPSGVQIQLNDLPLSGERTFLVDEIGVYNLRLTTSLETNGEVRELWTDALLQGM